MISNNFQKVTLFATMGTSLITFDNLSTLLRIKLELEGGSQVCNNSCDRKVNICKTTSLYVLNVLNGNTLYITLKILIYVIFYVDKSLYVVHFVVLTYNM
jgi:hypothetical protein